MRPVLLLLSLLLSAAPLAGQSMNPPLITPHRGAYLPTTGTVRGLLLCVQMTNDTHPNTAWPLDALPAWADSFTARLNRYFADMSGGTLDFRLDVFPGPVYSVATEQEYIERHQQYGQALKEIVGRIDTAVDFAPYDLWAPSPTEYDPQPRPDGQVDLIIVLFRSVSDGGFLPFTGASDLGFKGYVFVDGGTGRFVYGGTGQFNDAGSSGLTVCASPGSGKVLEEDFAFRVAIHELGHKFLGEAHPADVYGGLGLMARSGSGMAMNSFERHLAGYIHYRELTPLRDTVVTLRDALRTGEAALLPVPQADRSYFAFEYRSRSSEWDTAPARGLYVLRLYDAWSRSMKSALLVSAEGAFRWARDTVLGGIQPVAPDAVRGYNRFQRIPIDGTYYWADRYWGDPSAAYTPERPELAVWKNPSPDYIYGIDTVHTRLHMRVLRMTDTSVTFRLSFTDPPILFTERADAPAPATPAIDAIYPHPLRQGGTGSVRFTLPSEGDAALHLFDALGRRVAVIHGGALPAGAHSVEFPAGELPAGIYHLVLRTAGDTACRAFVITD